MNFVLTQLRIALIVVLFLAFAGLLVIPGRWIHNPTDAARSFRKRPYRGMLNHVSKLGSSRRGGGRTSTLSEFLCFGLTDA
jgi:hypothetical protein